MTTLALGALAGFVAYVWWFGVPQAGLGFALWLVASIPLLAATWYLTRVRTPLLGAIFVCVLVLAAWFADWLPSWIDFIGGAATVTLLPKHAVVAFIPAALIAPVLWLPGFVTMVLVRMLHARRAATTEEPRPPVIPRRRGARAIAVVAIAFATLGVVGGWTYGEVRKRTEDPAAAPRYAGCWSIRMTPWFPAKMRAHSVDGLVPPVIRLDEARAPSLVDAAGQAVYRHEQLHERGERLIRPGWWGSAYWTPLTGDRVQLVWSGGLHGLVMDLDRSGRDLRGFATTFTDYAGLKPDSRARVHAIPADCRLVPADTARIPAGPPHAPAR